MALDELVCRNAFHEIEWSQNPNYKARDLEEHYKTARLAVGYFDHLDHITQKELLKLGGALKDSTNPTLKDLAIEIERVRQKRAAPDSVMGIMHSFHVVEQLPEKKVENAYRQAQCREVYAFFERTLHDYLPQVLDKFEDEDKAGFLAALADAVPLMIFKDPRNTTVEERKLILQVLTGIGNFLLEYSEEAVVLGSEQQELEALKLSYKGFVRKVCRSTGNLAAFIFLHPDVVELIFDRVIVKLLSPYAFCVAFNEFFLKSFELTAADKSDHPIGMYDASDQLFTDGLNSLYENTLVPAIMNLGGRQNQAVRFGLDRFKGLFGEIVQKGLNQINSKESTSMPFALLNVLLYDRVGERWVPSLTNVSSRSDAESAAFQLSVKAGVEKRFMALIKEQIEGKERASVGKKMLSGFVSLGAWITDVDTFGKILCKKIFAMTQDQRYILRLLSCVFKQLQKEN